MFSSVLQISALVLFASEWFETSSPHEGLRYTGQDALSRSLNGKKHSCRFKCYR